MLAPAERLRYLQLLLRIDGAVLVLAFPAMLLPVDWMAAAHAWLGLGEFPRSAVVEYLARSIAALYGFHGLLVFIVATDPLKYIAIVRYLALMNIVFGGVMIAVDLVAGMPLFWVIAEGPPIILVGLIIGWLSRPLS